MRMLVAEDNSDLAQSVARLFREKGHAVDVAGTAEDAELSLTAAPYDLVVLDLGLPDEDGLELLRRMRRRGSRVPVLVLTARGSTLDRVRGLDLGADDYLAKPFEPTELEARARALMRRGVGAGGSNLVHGPLEIDTAGREAILSGTPLKLPRRELCLLELLVLHAGQVVRKDHILEKLFDQNEEVGPNAVELYVHRLRKKLEPAGLEIRTVRGVGYLLLSP
jgi:DNA-binding response OmpR family regulator